MKKEKTKYAICNGVLLKNVPVSIKKKQVQEILWQNKVFGGTCWGNVYVVNFFNEKHTAVIEDENHLEHDPSDAYFPNKYPGMIPFERMFDWLKIYEKAR